MALCSPDGGRSMVTRLPAHGWRRFTVRRVIDCKFFTRVYAAERKEIVAVVAVDIRAFALPWLIQIPSNRQSVKGRWTPTASISDDGKIFVQLSNSLWVFGDVRRLDPKHLLVVSLKQRTFLLDFPDCKYVHSTCPYRKCCPARTPLKSATFKKMKLRPSEPGGQNVTMLHCL